MKLLFYINVLCFGGAERVMTNLANYCCDSGEEVFFVTSYPLDQEYDLDKRINRINLSSEKIDGFVKKNLIYTRRLRTVIKHHDPDVIVSFLPEPNFRTIVASAGLRSKVIISVRNDPSVEYQRRIYCLLAKTLYPHADGMVFQTEDAKNWFSPIVQKKSKIIYNAVSPAFYENRIDCLGQGIVTVGNFKKQKNHALLINAFNLIKDDVKENLYIYGDGDERKNIEVLINKLNLGSRVFLLGQCSDIPSQLRKYRLFVLSSDYEGMPNALMEAMAIGLPCISTDCPCGGPRELFGGDRNYLVSVNDCEELSCKIKYFLQNDDSIKANAKFMKDKSLKFNHNVIFSEWKQYIYEVMTCENT